MIVDFVIVFGVCDRCGFRPSSSSPLLASFRPATLYLGTLSPCYLASYPPLFAPQRGGGHDVSDVCCVGCGGVCLIYVNDDNDGKAEC